MKTKTKVTEKPVEKQYPCAKFKSGCIQGTIWSKEIVKDDRKFDIYSYTIVRSYLDDKKEWQHTTSFRKQDTANVNAVMNRITDFLFIEEQEDNVEI